MKLHELVRAARPVEGDALRITGGDDELRAAIDPSRLQLTVEPGARLRLVVLHTQPTASRIELTAGEGASVELTELFTAAATAELTLTQAASSTTQLTLVGTGGAQLTCTTELTGADARCDQRALLLAGGEERCGLQLRTNHRVAGCTSRARVRGVAGGTATAEFRGLVYVAPDAQRTDAVQQSRNVLLSETARIDALPQLEIYADDVQCSHGATVGLLDRDAIFYLRQRGLCESQARQLQLTGFVSELLHDCGPAPLCEALTETVENRLKAL